MSTRVVPVNLDFNTWIHAAASWRLR